MNDVMNDVVNDVVNERPAHHTADRTKVQHTRANGKEDPRRNS